MAKLLAEQDRKTERRKKRPKTIAAATFNRARAETQDMIDSGDWSTATARHLVALYDLMHLKVYGVEALELGASERYTAAILAGGMVKREFNGDVVAMIRYMRWVWTREMGREKWRRENSAEGGRIGVRLIFSNRLLTDYRLSLARRGDKP